MDDVENANNEDDDGGHDKCEAEGASVAGEEGKGDEGYEVNELDKGDEREEFREGHFKVAYEKQEEEGANDGNDFLEGGVD